MSMIPWLSQFRPLFVNWGGSDDNPSRSLTLNKKKHQSTIGENFPPSPVLLGFPAALLQRAEQGGPGLALWSAL